MKKFSEKLEKFFMATAFAELGEFTTAKEILEERTRVQNREVQKPRMIPRINAPRI